MFVMYCMRVVCPCQLFCSAWMWCLEEVYRCLLCDMFSVVNVYLDHLKLYVVCINSRRYVCCSECMLSLMSVMSPLLSCATYRVRTDVKLCIFGVLALGASLVS